MFNSFQNDDVILRRYRKDGHGDNVLEQTINAKADVQYQRKNTFDNEGNIIEASAECFITPNSDLNALSIENMNKEWTLEVDSEERQTARFMRVRYPAKNEISHFELLLR